MTSSVTDGMPLDDIKADLLSTIGEATLIVTTFVELDLQRKRGEITAEQAMDAYAKFLLPAALFAVGVLEVAGDEMVTYITKAEETFDILREAMVS